MYGVWCVVCSVRRNGDFIVVLENDGMTFSPMSSCTLCYSWFVGLVLPLCMTMLVTFCIISFMKVHVILDAFFGPFLPPCVCEGYDPGWMILSSGTVWCVEKWWCQGFPICCLMYLFRQINSRLFYAIVDEYLHRFGWQLLEFCFSVVIEGSCHSWCSYLPFLPLCVRIGI